jgi:hypothetical protein
VACGVQRSLEDTELVVQERAAVAVEVTRAPIAVSLQVVATTSDHEAQDRVGASARAVGVGRGTVEFARRKPLVAVVVRLNDLVCLERSKVPCWRSAFPLIMLIPGGIERVVEVHRLPRAYPGRPLPSTAPLNTSNAVSPVAQARLSLDSVIVDKESLLVQLPHIGASAAFAMLGVIAVFGKRTGRTVARLFALVLGQVASDVLKGLTVRPRPLASLPGVRLLVPEPSSYAFPSGHATSAVSTATGVMLAARRSLKRVPLSGWGHAHPRRRDLLLARVCRRPLPDRRRGRSASGVSLRLDRGLVCAEPWEPAREV